MSKLAFEDVSRRNTQSLPHKGEYVSANFPRAGFEIPQGGAAASVGMEDGAPVIAFGEVANHGRASCRVELDCQSAPNFDPSSACNADPSAA